MKPSALLPPPPPPQVISSKSSIESPTNIRVSSSNGATSASGIDSILQSLPPSLRRLYEKSGPKSAQHALPGSSTTQAVGRETHGLRPAPNSRVSTSGREQSTTQPAVAKESESNRGRNQNPTRAAGRRGERADHDAGNDQPRPHFRDVIAPSEQRNGSGTRRRLQRSPSGKDVVAFGMSSGSSMQQMSLAGLGTRGGRGAERQRGGAGRQAEAEARSKSRNAATHASGTSTGRRARSRSPAAAQPNTSSLVAAVYSGTNRRRADRPETINFEDAMHQLAEAQLTTAKLRQQLRDERRAALREREILLRQFAEYVDEVQSTKSRMEQRLTRLTAAGDAVSEVRKAAMEVSEEAAMEAVETDGHTGTIDDGIFGSGFEPRELAALTGRLREQEEALASERESLRNERAAIAAQEERLARSFELRVENHSAKVMALEA